MKSHSVVLIVSPSASGSGVVDVKVPLCPIWSTDGAVKLAWAARRARCRHPPTRCRAPRALRAASPEAGAGTDRTGSPAGAIHGAVGGVRVLSSGHLPWMLPPWEDLGLGPTLRLRIDAFKHVIRADLTRSHGRLRRPAPRRRNPVPATPSARMPAARITSCRLVPRAGLQGVRCERGRGHRACGRSASRCAARAPRRAAGACARGGAGCAVNARSTCPANDSKRCSRSATAWAGRAAPGAARRDAVDAPDHDAVEPWRDRAGMVGRRGRPDDGGGDDGVRRRHRARPVRPAGGAATVGVSTGGGGPAAASASCTVSASCPATAPARRRRRTAGRPRRRTG